MITEQVKELDECAKKCQQYPFINVCMNNEGHDFRFIFRSAADTIKTLSEKVRAANMERSTAFYNGGWIPVKERLPKNCEYVLLTIRRMNKAFNHEPFVSVGYIGWSQTVWWCAHDGDCRLNQIDVLAWMPLPEPYREDDE
jgi:hypothetical protein